MDEDMNHTVRDRLSVYLQGRGWIPPAAPGTTGGLWQFPGSDWMLPVPNELVAGGSDWQQIIKRIALAENITVEDVEKSLSLMTGLLGMTERQAAAWPEFVARLNRAVEWVAVPENIRDWSVKWNEEIRPGRGRDLNATFMDGEVFAQIILDVYGYGSESVAELSWVHASADEECRCNVCKEESVNHTVAGSGEQIKVTYFTRSGSISKAYIDPETGEGTDKHSDIPITLAHQESDDSWYQIDHREWRVNHLGEFEEVMSPASEDVMALRGPRTQPKKKQSRAERRRKP